MSDIYDRGMAPAHLRIAIGQFGPQLGDVAGNLARLRRMLSGAAGEGAALACFPELSLSGYLLEAERYDERLLDEVESACATLAQDAARLGLDVVYGAPLRRGAGLVNAVIRDRPTPRAGRNPGPGDRPGPRAGRNPGPGDRPTLHAGRTGPSAGLSRAVYAKTHMDLKERRVFTPGTGFEPDPEGVFGLGCCYDLAFPEAIRSIVLAGSRVVLVPMAWEVERGFVMRRVVAARAVENVAVVVCVNQCGPVGDLRFLGASQVIDPLGETIAELGSEPELRIVELDLAAVDALRDRRDPRSYPLLADRRPELYGELARPQHG